MPLTFYVPMPLRACEVSTSLEFDRTFEVNLKLDFQNKPLCNTARSEAKHI